MPEALRVKNKIIKTPLLTIVQDLKRTLHNGKLSTIRMIGEDIRVSCVNTDHKGGYEENASAGIYTGKSTDKLHYGTYHCFSCNMACSFEHFVAMAFECSDETAQKWLIENYATESIDFEYDIPEIVIDKNKKQYIDESILQDFQSYHPYMSQRKLSKRIIEVFELKYDPKSQCVVFPVRDEHGKLFMLTRRSVEDKMFHIDKSKEKPLYLLYYIKQHNLKECVITEGQIDALTACTYGMPAVATMGVISDHQIETLNKSGVRIVYAMFDNDESGQRFFNNLKSKLRKDILLIKVHIDIPGKKDINDLSDEEFWYCIEKSKNNIV